MDTVPTFAELVGGLASLAAFGGMLAVAHLSCQALERLIARRTAKATRATIATGVARYHRQDTGTLVVRVHPSARAAA